MQKQNTFSVKNDEKAKFRVLPGISTLADMPLKLCFWFWWQLYSNPCDSSKWVRSIQMNEPSVFQYLKHHIQWFCRFISHLLTIFTSHFVEFYTSIFSGVKNGEFYSWESNTTTACRTIRCWQVCRFQTGEWYIRSVDGCRMNLLKDSKITEKLLVNCFNRKLKKDLFAPIITGDEM